MSSHPIVRRLTTAALLLVLATAPAVAAPRSSPPNGAHSPRVLVVTGVSLLDRLLDWLSFPAAGDPPGGRGAREKSGTGFLRLLPPELQDLLQGGEQERGGMIDPNG